MTDMEKLVKKELSKKNKRKTFKISLNEEDANLLMKKIKRDIGTDSFSQWVRHKSTSSFITQSLRHYSPKIEEYMKLTPAHHLSFVYLSEDKENENKSEYFRRAQIASCIGFKVSTGIQNHYSHEERIALAVEKALDHVKSLNPIARLGEPVRIDLAATDLVLNSLLVFYCFVETPDGEPMVGFSQNESMPLAHDPNDRDWFLK